MLESSRSVCMSVSNFCTSPKTFDTITFRRSTAQSMHTEDKDMRRKEQHLPPFSKAYCTAVRTGLCNAYLAASVVASSLVCTSMSGGMGKVSCGLGRVGGCV